MLPRRGFWLFAGLLQSQREKHATTMSPDVGLQTRIVENGVNQKAEQFA
jgi:hypothetical protein